MDIGKKIGLQYGPATRDAFGETLRDLGGENENIVVIDGDVNNSTRTEFFAEKYPQRFFNLGIAESNMVSTGSGMAAAGKDVIVSSFAVFLIDNAYDQIRMGIAFPHLPVRLVGSHSGISIGEDGPSQMSIEDLALTTALPGFTVLVPADAPSTKALTRAMFELDGPSFLRTGRSKCAVVYPDGADFKIGKANQLRDGKDLTIIACGLMVAAALEAAADLEAEGIQSRVLDMHTVKPLDEEAIEQAARETGAIVTAEEHLLEGGLGAGVARVVSMWNPVPMGFVGIHNTYAESGKPEELFEKFGLMPEDIVRVAKETVNKKSANLRG